MTDMVSESSGVNCFVQRFRSTPSCFIDAQNLILRFSRIVSQINIKQNNIHIMSSYFSSVVFDVCFKLVNELMMLATESLEATLVGTVIQTMVW